MTAKATQPRTREQELGAKIIDDIGCLREQLMATAGLLELLVRCHEADQEAIFKLRHKVGIFECTINPYATDISQHIPDEIGSPASKLAVNVVGLVEQFVGNIETIAKEMAGGAK